MNFSKTQKRSALSARDKSKDLKGQRLNDKSSFISMREARQIAEHVFSGIAWSG